MNVNNVRYKAQGLSVDYVTTMTYVKPASMPIEIIIDILSLAYQSLEARVCYLSLTSL